MKESEAINMVKNLPEVKANIYALAFGFSNKKVNELCSNKKIPCRKIGQAKTRTKDNRTWMVNMIKVRAELGKNSE